MAKLYFKYGAMGSSKTAQALITKYNYEENDLRVWLLKPSADIRDGAHTISSRIGLSAEADILTPEMDAYAWFREKLEGQCDVIIVDECQFLTPEQIEATTKRTVNGGAEVVELLKTGSAFYAPGSSIAKMVEAILNDTHEVMSVCAYLEGEYGIEDTYMCVPVELGRNGVEKIVELDVNAAELAELQASAASIAAQVDSLGLRA